MAEESQAKVRVGWFSYSCCEDSTIVFTEILNDHWQEWKDILDFRHARVLQSNNTLDEMDVAFIEGAIAMEEHEEMVKKIRDLSKYVVAVGSCAVTGMPSAQRNLFDEEKKEDIEPIVERFGHLDTVKKLSDVIKVDFEIPGCPMSEEKFLETLNTALEALKA